MSPSKNNIVGDYRGGITLSGQKRFETTRKSHRRRFDCPTKVAGVITSLGLTDCRGRGERARKT